LKINGTDAQTTLRPALWQCVYAPTSWGVKFLKLHDQACPALGGGAQCSGKTEQLTHGRKTPQNFLSGALEKFLDLAAAMAEKA
jgi:hypothetical protein